MQNTYKLNRLFLLFMCCTLILLSISNILKAEDGETDQVAYNLNFLDGGGSYTLYYPNTNSSGIYTQNFKPGNSNTGLDTLQVRSNPIRVYYKFWSDAYYVAPEIYQYAHELSVLRLIEYDPANPSREKVLISSNSGSGYIEIPTKCAVKIKIFPGAISYTTQSGPDRIRYAKCTLELGITNLSSLSPNDVVYEIKQDMSSYFPTNRIGGNYNTQPTGGISDLKIRNYPIRMYYNFWSDAYYIKPEIYKYAHTLSSFQIISYDPDHPSSVKYYYATQNVCDGYVEIPANQGVKINVSTGGIFYVTQGSQDVVDHANCTLKLHYKIDSLPPTSPGEIKLANVINMDGQNYINKKPVQIQWEPSVEPAVEPISGIDYYTINGKKVSTNSYTDGGTLFPTDGEYAVLLKAYDKEGNESPEVKYRFTLDSKINGIEASDITVVSDYNNKTAMVSWPEISDDFNAIKGSGIKGYQVILTQDVVAPQNVSPDTDLLTVTNKTFKDLSAKKIYYIWIRAIDRAGNVSSWTLTKFSPQPQYAQIFECTPVSKIVNNQPLYMVNLKLSDVDTVSYVIKRQEANNPTTLKEVDEVKYDVIQSRAFKQVDSGLAKHTKYQYFIYTKNALGEVSSQSTMAPVTTANLEPQCTIKGLREIEVATELNYTLGSKTDLEGDQLTYRLYLRAPNGGDGVVAQSWEPKVDDLKVSYTFKDKTDYEWRISCIESNADFASKEVFASGWNALTVDTDGIIPVFSNERGLIGETNLPSKKQPLTFTVEYNPKKKFTSYQWDFGDSKSASGDTAGHTYTALNQYPVTVMASDEAGVLRKGSRKIYIENTHQGKLYDNEEWIGTHGIYGEVVVPQGITLTLKPGTNVQVSNSAGSIRVNGILSAVDPNQSILIDRQGPLEYWNEIRFENAGAGTLSGVTISHARRGIVTVGTGSLSLTNVNLDSNYIGLNYIKGNVIAIASNFKANRKFGIKSDNGVIFPTLTNCIFFGNGVHYVDAAELPYTIEDVNQSPSSGNVFK